MVDTYIKLGGLTSSQRFEKSFQYSVSILKKRFGGWRGAKARLADWLDTKGIKFPYRDQLTANIVVTDDEELEPLTRSMPNKAWDKGTGPQYGEFLNFRGLQHAPINEQGVVFLFGMIAREIGYVVEAVQTGYPDCDAKRQVGNGRWQRVRIEFEYLARNFRDHGHDPSKCDLIVCWDNNWPEASIEVVALKEVIAKLGS